MRKIRLIQKQSPGDILVFTRAVADLKMTFPDWQIDVQTPCPDIFKNNPRLTYLSTRDKEVEEFNIEYPEVHNSGWSGIHFSEAFIRDVENKVGVSIKRTGIKPELWLSNLEKSMPSQVQEIFGWNKPYWILNAGYKPDNELKFYHRWQEVVDIFNETFQDKIKLVQVGEIHHNHPKLTGVLDLIGKTDLRQLILLAYNAHGTITPISFLTHVSGALEQPNVTVAGGKEGWRWEAYCNSRYIYTNGCLECCKWDGCWLGGEKGLCKDLIMTNKGKVPKCFEMITPNLIIDMVKWYYTGGLLKL